MSLWFKDYTIKDAQQRCDQTLVDHLGIEFSQMTRDSLHATMAVSRHTCQPLGILHGGASCVLAETLGSVAANMAN